MPGKSLALPGPAHGLAKGAGKARLVIDCEKGANLDALIAMVEIHGRRALVLVPVEQQPHLLGIKPAHLLFLAPCRSHDFDLVGPDGDLFHKLRPARLPHRNGSETARGNSKAKDAGQQKFRHGNEEGQAQ